MIGCWDHHLVWAGSAFLSELRLPRRFGWLHKGVPQLYLPELGLLNTNARLEPKYTPYQDYRSQMTYQAMLMLKYHH
jgi:hypothetical protein